MVCNELSHISCLLFLVKYCTEENIDLNVPRTKIITLSHKKAYQLYQFMIFYMHKKWPSSGLYAYMNRTNAVHTKVNVILHSIYKLFLRNVYCGHKTLGGIWYTTSCILKQHSLGPTQDNSWRFTKDHMGLHLSIPETTGDTHQKGKQHPKKAWSPVNESTHPDATPFPWETCNPESPTWR